MPQLPASSTRGQKGFPYAVIENNKERNCHNARLPMISLVVYALRVFNLLKFSNYDVFRIFLNY